MINLLTLQNKNIIITGASSGIGRQCAITASRLGATVALMGRNKQRLEETLSYMEHGNHLITAGDITVYDTLGDTVARIVKHTGKISGFIHSAGIEMTKPLKSMAQNEYESLFATNVISGLELAKIISQKKHFAEEGASFIYVASVMGFLGQPGKVGYCASKGALVPATKAMALELASKNIRVNCLLLGIVETEMANNLLETVPEERKYEIIKRHPLGLGKPEDVAYYCAFLLSDLSRWVTGSSIVIDGGYSAG